MAGYDLRTPVERRPGGIPRCLLDAMCHVTGHFRFLTHPGSYKCPLSVPVRLFVLCDSGTQIDVAPELIYNISR